MLKGSRGVYFPEFGRHIDTPVYNRYAMRQGTTIEGPAIVEEMESTVVIIPGWDGRIDKYLNLVIEQRAKAKE